MTKIISGDEYTIVRDVYDGHILTCDACGLPFFPNEWYRRHECDPDKVYHEECCPVCNQDTSPDCHSDAEGGL